MTEISKVLLVDLNDNPIGVEEKLKAHQNGLLHRAFSLFIYRKKINGDQFQIEILLQKRHSQKYHSGGLWTNTCCSHPYPNEDIIDAAKRRLKEETGIDVIHLRSQEIKKLGIFHYTEKVSGDLNLIENEMDYVLSGEMIGDSALIFNSEEISEMRWVEVNTLLDDLSKHPQQYTVWLKKALDIMISANIF